MVLYTLDECTYIDISDTYVQEVVGSILWNVLDLKIYVWQWKLSHSLLSYSFFPKGSWRPLCVYEKKCSLNKLLQ